MSITAPLEVKLASLQNAVDVLTELLRVERGRVNHLDIDISTLCKRLETLDLKFVDAIHPLTVRVRRLEHDGLTRKENLEEAAWEPPAKLETSPADVEELVRENDRLTRRVLYLENEVTAIHKKNHTQILANRRLHVILKDFLQLGSHDVVSTRSVAWESARRRAEAALNENINAGA